MKTVIYFLDASSVPEEEALLRAAGELSRSRQEKAAKLRFPEDRILSLGAGLLLDRGLQKYGLREREVELEYRHNGKPYLKNHPELFFNLSHSGTMVMATFSDREIGCDIEKIRKTKMALVHRYFAKEEQLFLEQEQREEERDRLFSRYWTLKESVLKATGEGMRLPLDSFELQLADFSSESPVKLIWHTDAGEKFPSLCFREYEFSGYQAAVCRKGTDDGLSNVFFSFQNLQDVVR